ncbi:hypothetical protein [Terricaulis silvestris]|uniref:Uncharacterized protein n=1 Tax=Terricaulis silvestris TaxID=2686094 RepID=A0A6I6MUM6_9CAUL|nr:hypothetical protein [Terricaulis silvestris]QGZ97088.1 hypothetical protein DSM104635_03954 [Terricaulis silvestris]
MSSSHDPFSALFDALDVDLVRAPDALDHALAIAAPTAAAPDLTSSGFYLIDDVGGRFEVDREFGVITLKDESILATEHGAIHSVRLRVIEQSGARYDMDMRLRLTGRVPQMVGAEDNAFLVGLASGETHQAAPVAPQAVAAPQTVARLSVEVPAPFASWTRYAAAHAAPGKAELVRTRRTFISAELPAIAADIAALSIDEALPPVGLRGPWPY